MMGDEWRAFTCALLLSAAWSGCGGQESSVARPAERQLCRELAFAVCDRLQECALHLRVVSEADARAFLDGCEQRFLGDCDDVREVSLRFDACVEDLPDALCEVDVTTNRLTIGLSTPTSCVGVLAK